MSSCRTNKDCLSTETCISSRCEVPNNKSKQLSTGAYVGIGVGALVLLGIIIAVCIRANRSSKKEKYKKSSEFKAQSSEQGPAPLPSGYKKPVDLLQVAEQNKRIEEAEEKKRIKQQNNNNPNANYQANQTNGYVSVPLSQVFVVAQGSPNRQNIVPGSFPAQYVDPRQQGSASYGYPEIPQQAFSEKSVSYVYPPSNIDGVRPLEFMDTNTNYRLGQPQPHHGQPHVGYSQQVAYSDQGISFFELTKVAPPRSYARELQTETSYPSDRSNVNRSGLSQKKHIVKNVQDLPTLPAADYSKE